MEIKIYTQKQIKKLIDEKFDNKIYHLELRIGQLFKRIYKLEEMLKVRKVNIKNEW